MLSELRSLHCGLEMLNSRVRSLRLFLQRNTFLALLFDSQIIIAISSTSLAAETFLLCDYPIDFGILGLIFFSTLMLYNLAHLRIEMPNMMHDIVQDRSIHGWLIRFSMLALLPFLLFSGWAELLLLFLIGFASVAYVMPFVQNDSKLKGLRDVPVLKNIFLAFSWSAATVALPLSSNELYHVQQHDLMIFFQRFFFIFALSLLFDIRDSKYDQSEGVSTIVGIAGESRVKTMAAFSIVVFMILCLLDQFFFFDHIIYWPAFLISSATLLILIFISAPANPRWFFAGIVDSTTTMQFILLILLLSVSF